jgi:hypothetical protein
MTKEGWDNAKCLTLLRRNLAACLLYRYMTKERMAVKKGQMLDRPEEGLSQLVWYTEVYE